MNDRSPGSVPSRTRPAVGAALAAVTALATAGCSLTGDETHSSSRSYTAGKDGARLTALDVDSHGGSITVKAAGPGRRTVGVTEDRTWDATRPRTTHSLRAGTLRLTADDCGGNGDRCRVDYTVTVPASLPVRLTTGGGDIVVNGTSGPVVADTGGGGIRMPGSRVREVKARTGGGSMSGTFLAVPDAVRFESGGGNVTVRLPEGTYAVDATTDGGRRSVQVPTDSSAGHRITAHSAGGNVSVLGS